MTVWTHGVWVVKPGNEEGFASAWREMATSMVSAFGSASPTLLRDREHANVFLTFASWPDLETAEAVRASAVLRQSMEVIRPMIESVEIMTLDHVDRA